MLMETDANEELLTGLIYINENKQDFMSTLKLVDTPLALMEQERVRPGPEALQELMNSLM